MTAVSVRQEPCPTCAGTQTIHTTIGSFGLMHFWCPVCQKPFCVQDATWDDPSDDY